jgi:hypothetical protein
MRIVRRLIHRKYEEELTMEELKNVLVSLTDEELEEAAGAAGCGWSCTITDDCPNSVFVCC